MKENKAPWTVRSVQQWGRDFLLHYGIPNPELDAELLLRHVLGMDRTAILLQGSKEISDAMVNRFRDLIFRRSEREPAAYILGVREFWGFPFRVTPDVLIPRPETELILETVLRLLSSRKRDSGPLRFLDLGSGTGCLAISLALEFDRAVVDSADISAAALDVARENAVRHGLERRVRWLLGDLYAPLHENDVRYDLIVSNPPYIPRGEMKQLPLDVRNYEPDIALDGGEDGLDFYRRIVEEAPGMLKEGGYGVVEVGLGQASAVGEMIRKQSGISLEEVCKDLAGIERVVVGTRR
ncbi:MAG: peptide chain release factor N(5)-glutamine methyltransferase [Nitrospirae bacterium]|nr:peptide chain release factor N(5)-glutamine methyltransferase [Nitrospirota bacterium]